MRFLFLIVIPVLVFAGRVSQWSETFVLSDPKYTAISDAIQEGEPPFDLKASPNPFNPATVLYVSGIVRDAESRFEIFNISGKKVADLTPALVTGAYAILWNAQSVSSGVYLARLQCGKQAKNLKLILMR